MFITVSSTTREVSADWRNSLNSNIKQNILLLKLKHGVLCNNCLLFFQIFCNLVRQINRKNPEKRPGGKTGKGTKCTLL